MSSTLRHAARAIVLDEDDRVLLCRFVPPTQRSRTEYRASGPLRVVGWNRVRTGSKRCAVSCGR